MSNLVTNLVDAVSEYGENTAVHYDDTDITYEELWGRIGMFAAGLQEHEFGAGDAVGIYLPNLPEFVTAFHGTLRAGGVVVPMNPQYKSREIKHLLDDSEAQIVVTLPDLVEQVAAVKEETTVETVIALGADPGDSVAYSEFLAEGAPDVVARADDDVAVQPYTSGTTGQPKGVELTHRNLTSNSKQSSDIIPDGIRPADKQIGVLPLFHIYGMTVVMNATLFKGGSYFPLPSWEAQQATDLVAEQGITIFHGVPAMYNDLINQPNAEEFDFSSVRLCGVGGSGIPVEVLRRFEELYQPRIYEGYGLTETSPVTHFNSPNWGRRVGSIGQTLPGVDCRVVTEEFEAIDPVPMGPLDEDDTDLDEVTGELVIAGPNVMKGYHGLPDANADAFTERDGKHWFHTGDIGYHDEDGYYYVVDRMKHMINTAGYNVYPREVEELLFEHEAVADVAIVGIPDDRRGETVKAYVVPTPGADATEDDLKQFVLDNLAEYKHPREVEFVEALPRTTTGKVKKFELADD